jgi:MscS family membrane protein
VEQVGFRSTRLRTAEDSLLTIPNAIIAAAPIDNMGARSQRRFSTTVMLSPDTPCERLREFRDRVRAWLDKQSLVVQDKVDLHIHQITSQGVDLSLSLFLTAASPAEETRFREAINYEILQQAETLGVDISPAHRRSLVDKVGERTGASLAQRSPRAA